MSYYFGTTKFLIKLPVRSMNALENSRRRFSSQVFHVREELLLLTLLHLIVHQGSVMVARCAVAILALQTWIHSNVPPVEPKICSERLWKCPC